VPELVPVAGLGPEPGLVRHRHQTRATPLMLPLANQKVSSFSLVFPPY